MRVERSFLPMSEQPMSLIDDKKSSPVTYNTDQVIKNTDQIMNDHEARGAFFEHAKNGNLYTPKPPEFDIYEEPKAFDPNMMTETNDQSFTTEAPVYTEKIVTHEETLERAYHYMDTLELVADARLCTKAVIVTRGLYLGA